MASYPVVTLKAVASTVEVRIINTSGADFQLTASDDASGDFDSSNWNQSITYPGSGTSLPSDTSKYHDTSVDATATMLRAFFFASNAKSGDAYVCAILVSSPNTTWTDKPRILDMDPASFMIDEAPAGSSGPASLTVTAAPQTFVFDNETQSTQFKATAESDLDKRFTGLRDWLTSGAEYDSDIDIGNAKGSSNATVDWNPSAKYVRIFIYDPSRDTGPIAGALIDAQWKSIVDYLGSNYSFALSTPVPVNGTATLTLTSASKPNPWLPTSKGALGLPMWAWYALGTSAFVIILAMFAHINRRRAN